MYDLLNIVSTDYFIVKRMDFCKHEDKKNKIPTHNQFVNYLALQLIEIDEIVAKRKICHIVFERL